MAKKKRDYQAEYRRRVERAQKRGLSKSQARGHPRAGEQGLRAKARAKLLDARLQHALHGISKGNTLAEAAKVSGLSAERLRKYLAEHKLGQKRKGRWRLITKRLRWEWAIFSDGAMVFIIVSDPATNSVVGAYLNAVRQFLLTNDPRALKRFRGVTVKDAAGKKYLLETNPNSLYRLDSVERETPEDFYKFSVPRL